MNRLAVFDIDGTLIRHLPSGNDGCYLRALEDEFGITGVRDDASRWAAYTHSTDSGITEELIRDRLGRDACEDDVTRVKSRMLEYMPSDFRSGSLRHEATPGAVDLLPRLEELTEWHVAVATGNWEASGRLKLEIAGVRHEGVPLGSADDSRDRAAIIGAAIVRARERWGTADYRHVVYIGDRPWDHAAASRLGIGFLGIAAGVHETALREAGAGHVLADFQSFEGFIEALTQAASPK